MLIFVVLVVFFTLVFTDCFALFNVSRAVAACFLVSVFGVVFTFSFMVETVDSTCSAFVESLDLRWLIWD